MAIKCIALDLDGTTLDSNGKLPQVNRQAIQAAIARGMEVVIASGRAFGTLPQEVLDIPGIGWAITSNGAAVYRLPQGEAVFRCTLPGEAAEAILHQTAAEQICYETFVDGVAYTDQRMYDDPIAFGCTDYGAKYIWATRTPVPDIRAFILDNREQLDSIALVLRSREERDRLWRSLEQQFPELYITSSFFHLLELSSPNSGKANALAWVLEQLGLTAEEAVAFGNADNDIDMLQMAGVGVAVADATESCRRAADRCTRASYDGGVAQALEELLHLSR